MMTKLPLPQAPAAGLAAVNSFTSLLDAWNDYKKTCEREMTERERIRADRDVKLERIRSQRVILEKYLENTFAERHVVIKGMFDALDRGIEKGDTNLMSQAMDSIVNTIRSSPLAGIQNLIAQVDDPNVDAIDI